MREVSLMKQPLERSTDRPLAMLFSSGTKAHTVRHNGFGVFFVCVFVY